MFFDNHFGLTTLKSRLLNGTSFSQIYSRERLPLGKLRQEGAFLAPLIAGLLAACGSDGQSVLQRPLITETLPTPTEVPPVVLPPVVEPAPSEPPPDGTFAVYVADGPVKDARIFFDSNDNDQLDDGELVGTTDETGAAQVHVRHNGALLKVDLTGAFDTYTGQQFDSGVYTLDTTLLTVASPISTMINQLVAANEDDTLTAEQKVQAAIENIFGSDTPIGLRHLDYLDNYKLTQSAPAATVPDSAPEAIQDTIATTAIVLQKLIEQEIADADTEGDEDSAVSIILADETEGVYNGIGTDDLDTDVATAATDAITHARTVAKGDPTADPDITRGANTESVTNEDTAITIDVEDWGFLDPNGNTGTTESTFASVAIISVAMSRTEAQAEETAQTLPTANGDILGEFILANGQRFVLKSDGSDGYTTEYYVDLDAETTTIFPDAFGATGALVFSSADLVGLQFIPATDQFGTATISFKVNDGEVEQTQAYSLVIAVASVNDGPPVPTLSGDRDSGEDRVRYALYDGKITPRDDTIGGILSSADLEDGGLGATNFAITGGADADLFEVVAQPITVSSPADIADVTVGDVVYASFASNAWTLAAVSPDDDGVITPPDGGIRIGEVVLDEDGALALQTESHVTMPDPVTFTVTATGTQTVRLSDITAEVSFIESASVNAAFVQELDGPGKIVYATLDTSTGVWSFGKGDAVPEGSIQVAVINAAGDDFDSTAFVDGAPVGARPTVADDVVSFTGYFGANARDGDIAFTHTVVLPDGALDNDIEGVAIGEYVYAVRVLTNDGAEWEVRAGTVTELTQEGGIRLAKVNNGGFDESDPDHTAVFTDDIVSGEQSSAVFPREVSFTNAANAFLQLKDAATEKAPGEAYKVEVTATDSDGVTSVETFVALQTGIYVFVANQRNFYSNYKLPNADGSPWVEGNGILPENANADGSTTAEPIGELRIEGFTPGTDESITFTLPGTQAGFEIATGNMLRYTGSNSGEFDVPAKDRTSYELTIQYTTTRTHTDAFSGRVGIEADFSLTTDANNIDDRTFSLTGGQVRNIRDVAEVVAVDAVPDSPVKATVDIAGIRFTADTAGVDGNSISIKIAISTNAGTGVESTSIATDNANEIIITLLASGATLNDIIAAVTDSAAVAALIDAALVDASAGTTSHTAVQTTTSLTGGSAFGGGTPAVEGKAAHRIINIDAGTIYLPDGGSIVWNARTDLEIADRVNNVTGYVIVQDLNGDGDANDEGEISYVTDLPTSGAFYVLANIATDAAGGDTRNVNNIGEDTTHTDGTALTYTTEAVSETYIVNLENVNDNAPVFDVATSLADGGGAVTLTADDANNQRLARINAGSLDLPNGTISWTDTTGIVVHEEDAGFLIVQDSNGDGDADDTGEIRFVADTDLSTIVGAYYVVLGAVSAETAPAVGTFTARTDAHVTADETTLAAKASATEGGMVFTADNEGAAGNDITIAIVIGTGTDNSKGVSSITVTDGTDITITTPNTEGVTRQQVIDALTNRLNDAYNAEAAALVDVALAGNNAGTTTLNQPLAQTPLANGRDGPVEAELFTAVATDLDRQDENLETTAHESHQRAISYSIASVTDNFGTAVADMFEIDAATGVVSLVAGMTLDKEAANANGNQIIFYTITVTASATFVKPSETQTTNQIYQLAVNDVNDAPTGVSLDGTLHIPAEIPSDGVLVGTLTAIDVDDTDGFTFAIGGGADAELFAVRGDQLFFVGAADDLQATYNLYIIVTDDEGAALEVPSPQNDGNIAPNLTITRYDLLLEPTDNSEVPLPTGARVLDENADGSGTSINLGTLSDNDAEITQYTTDTAGFAIMNGNELHYTDSNSGDFEAGDSLTVSITGQEATTLMDFTGVTGLNVNGEDDTGGTFHHTGTLALANGTLTGTSGILFIFDVDAPITFVLPDTDITGIAATHWIYVAQGDHDGNAATDNVWVVQSAAALPTSGTFYVLGQATDANTIGTLEGTAVDTATDIIHVTDASAETVNYQVNLRDVDEAPTVTGLFNEVDWQLGEDADNTAQDVSLAGVNIAPHDGANAAPEYTFTLVSSRDGTDTPPAWVALVGTPTLTAGALAATLQLTGTAVAGTHDFYIRVDETNNGNGGTNAAYVPIRVNVDTDYSSSFLTLAVPTIDGTDVGVVIDTIANLDGDLRIANPDNSAWQVSWDAFNIVFTPESANHIIVARPTDAPGVWAISIVSPEEFAAIPEDEDVYQVGVIDSTGLNVIEDQTSAGTRVTVSAVDVAASVEGADDAFSATWAESTFVTPPPGQDQDETTFAANEYVIARLKRDADTNAEADPDWEIILRGEHGINNNVVVLGRINAAGTGLRPGHHSALTISSTTLTVAAHTFTAYWSAQSFNVGADGSNTAGKTIIVRQLVDGTWRAEAVDVVPEPTSDGYISLVKLGSDGYSFVQSTASPLVSVNANGLTVEASDLRADDTYYKLGDVGSMTGTDLADTFSIHPSRIHTLEPGGGADTVHVHPTFGAGGQNQSYFDLDYRLPHISYASSTEAVRVSLSLTRDNDGYMTQADIAGSETVAETLAFPVGGSFTPFANRLWNGEDYTATFFLVEFTPPTSTELHFGDPDGNGQHGLYFLYGDLGTSQDTLLFGFNANSTGDERDLPTVKDLPEESMSNANGTGWFTHFNAAGQSIRFTYAHDGNNGITSILVAADQTVVEAEEWGGGDAQGDRFSGAVRNLIGSEFDDVLFGDTFSNYLEGGAGQDTLDAFGHMAETDKVLTSEWSGDIVGYAGSDASVKVDLESSVVDVDGYRWQVSLTAGTIALSATMIDHYVIARDSDNDGSWVVETIAALPTDTHIYFGQLNTAGTAWSVAPHDDNSVLTITSDNLVVTATDLGGGDATGDRLKGFESVVGSNFNDDLMLTVSLATNSAAEGRGGADRITGSDDVTSRNYTMAHYTGSLSPVKVSLASPVVDVDGYIWQINKLAGIAASDAKAISGNGGSFVLATYDSSANEWVADFHTSTAKDALDAANTAYIELGQINAAGDAFEAGGVGTIVSAPSGNLVVVEQNPGLGGGDATGDHFLNVTGLGGSEFDDELTGGDATNLLWGRGGDDTIRGGQGSDILYGQTGNDLLYGEAGADDLYGGDGDDMLFGGAGNDNLYGHTGDDMLFGGSGNDRLEGGAGRDIMIGGAGDDIIIVEINFIPDDDRTADVVVDFSVVGDDKIRVQPLDLTNDQKTAYDALPVADAVDEAAKLAEFFTLTKLSVQNDANYDTGLDSNDAAINDVVFTHLGADGEAGGEGINADAVVLVLEDYTDTISTTIFELVEFV